MNDLQAAAGYPPIESCAVEVSAGYEIVYPPLTGLQLDLDSAVQSETFNCNWPRFKGLIREEYEAEPTYTETRSKGGNRHIHITLPFCPDQWQRIAFQASLGSDPTRELLSAFRALRNDPHPTLLIEKKES